MSRVEMGESEKQSLGVTERPATTALAVPLWSGHGRGLPGQSSSVGRRTSAITRAISALATLQQTGEIIPDLLK